MPSAVVVMLLSGLPAQVIDKTCAILRELSSLCTEAVAAWENEFEAVGKPVP